MEIAFLKTLEAAGIEFIRILWCDNANIIRSKAIHRGILMNHLLHGVGISCAQQAVPVMSDSISPGSGLGPAGEVFLAPDWETFTPLPYASSHARVMSNMTWKNKPWALCPRHFLRMMMKEAASEGLELLAAFENEFYLFDSSRAGVVPVDLTLFATTASMDINRKVIGDIVEALLRQGLKVMQYYPESGPGEHEISIHYAAPLQAADNQVAFRETVRAIAHNNGLKASFLPKIFMNQAGSGCHLHLSLWSKGKSIVTAPREPDGLSKAARGFIAGILDHLPALMAITTPIPNSYRRIVPHAWAGAFRCWGLDNREAAIRVLTDPVTGMPTHFEFKVADGASNPYLALGVVIAAGLDGVRRGLEPGKPVDVDPANLSEKEQKKLGIEALPASLEKTIGALERDSIITGALGEALAMAYIAVKKNELQHMKDFKLADEVEILLERY